MSHEHVTAQPFTMQQGGQNAVSLQAKLLLAVKGPNSDTPQSLELTRGRETFRQAIMFNFYNQLKQAITRDMQQCNQQVPTGYKNHIGLAIQGDKGENEGLGRK